MSTLRTLCRLVCRRDMVSVLAVAAMALCVASVPNPCFAADTDPFVVLPLGGVFPPLSDRGPSVQRHTYVRPSTPFELSSNPPEWQFFPPFQTPPPSPAQGDIILTSTDPLTIVVPMFEHLGETGPFETALHVVGNKLTLNAYSIFTGGVTATIYGPHEYLQMAGALPPGTYSLEINYLSAVDFDWSNAKLAGMSPFLDDPDGFAAAHGISITEVGTGGAPGCSPPYVIHRETDQFTVVPSGIIPEPASMALLLLGGLGLLRRWRSK